MSFQLFVLTYVRFVLAGYLAGAWDRFGVLAAQLPRLGTLLSIAEAENAMAAMAYGRSVRMTIETNSRKRTSPEMATEMIAMLTGEHDPTQKAIAREINAATLEKKGAKETALKTTLKDKYHYGPPP